MDSIKPFLIGVSGVSGEAKTSMVTIDSGNVQNVQITPTGAIIISVEV